MSFYLRVDRLGQKPKILSFRGVGGSIGEDEMGLISCSKVIMPFFSLVMEGNSYLLRAHIDSLLINGKVVPANTGIPVSLGDCITIDDYIFCLIPLPNSTDILAFSDLSNEEISETSDTNLTGGVIVRFNGTELNYPLYNNVRCWLGSSNRASICLHSEEILPFHLCIHPLQNQTVQLLTKSGTVVINGIEIGAEGIMPNTGSAVLIPFNLNLEFYSDK